MDTTNLPEKPMFPSGIKKNQQLTISTSFILGMIAMAELYSQQPDP